MSSRYLCLILAATMMRGQTPLPEIYEELAEANCLYWGKRRARFQQAVLAAQGARAKESAVGRLTVDVMRVIPGGSRTSLDQDLDSANVVDRHLFAAMEAAGVRPAAATNDYEFCRRVTLDLTGRIPTPERLLQFVNDRAADKRARYIEELFARAEWLDKWTMYFGDHLKNNSTNTQTKRFSEGVEAFNGVIRSALQTNKPYDVFVRELITATGTHSYQQGALNFLVGGIVTGGPVQDVWDQQVSNIADTFLGLSHLNCLLCHNGRGHLDDLSLWGRGKTRYQAWGMASYLSRTATIRTPIIPGQVNPFYWSIEDNTRYRADYTLATTGGNRPDRVPTGSQPRNVLPNYILTDEGPRPGENHRAALARQLTGDPQFARATVNYLWAYFFGKGIVDPPDQFDPARLDPDNPPPAPWKLQPSNPQLLNALAQEFINAKYDLKWLMRTIVNSRAYQLSARYEGEWNPVWEDLFARKFVRRLWAEEVHDNVAQATGVAPSYTSTDYGALTWAMKFPETQGLPGAGRNAGVTNFLNSFLRGDRDEEERSGEGSIAQALNMMNDPFVMTRVQSNGPAGSLLVRLLALPNEQMVDQLFLNVLSRYPTAAERQTALNNLSIPSTRNAEAENLLWSLFNKVDFLFNY